MAGLTFDIPPLRTSEFTTPQPASAMGSVGPAPGPAPVASPLDFAANAPAPMTPTPDVAPEESMMEKIGTRLEAFGAGMQGREPMYMKLARHKLEQDAQDTKKLEVAHTVMSDVLGKWPMLDKEEQATMMMTAGPLLEKLGIKDANKMLAKLSTHPDQMLAYSGALEDVTKGDTQEAKGLQAILKTTPKNQWGKVLLDLSKDKDYQEHRTQVVAASVGAKLPQILAGIPPDQLATLKEGGLTQAELVGEAAKLKTPDGQPMFNRHELIALSGDNKTITDIMAGNGITTSETIRKKQEFEALEASKIRIAAAGASNQTVNMPPQEKAEAKKVGELFGTQYAEIQQAGVTAGSKLSKLDRFESLSKGIETGKLAPAITELQALGKSLGIEVGADLAPKQAMQALSKEVALTLRNPSGGAGMPGALSDKDREFLESMVPGLEKTPEGNKLILETARKLEKRSQEIAKLTRDYRKKHGQADEGMFDEIQKYGDAHPLFETNKNRPLTPAEKAELDILRKKHGK
jgi:hypothetical protein